MSYQRDFGVDEEVQQLGVRGRYVIITGVTNESTPYHQLQADELRTAREWLAKNPNWKLTDPILAGFRSLHTKIGRSNRDNIAASENLLRLLEKRGSVPSINPVVDIYNIVSLQTRLSLGAHDLAKVDGPVRLARTDGSEYFLPLGSAEPKHIYPDEYAYVDDKEIVCRLETRQIEKTKVTAKTKDVIYVIQGNEQTAEDYLDEALEKLIDLTTRHVGGVIRNLPVVIKGKATINT